MDLDNFIIGKTKERREEQRRDLAKKKQQLLSKHRATTDGKRQLTSISAAKDMV